MKYMKIDEAARYLFCSVRILRIAIKKREINPIEIARTYLFTEADLIEFAESKRVYKKKVEQNEPK